MDQYNFSDFTEENYRKIIRLAKGKYSFRTYGDVDSMKNGVIWRHDIDMSVHRALALSRIEKEEGVFATWFVLLHSSFYNVFEKNIYRKLKMIKENGGIIGLHFDPDFYESGNSDITGLEEKLILEKELLERVLETEIDVFSFHNPDTGGGFLDLEQTHIAGMRNVYHSSIRNQFSYCSDSNGYWRYRRLEDMIRDGRPDEKIQILTHPVFWQKEGMSPRERVMRCVDGRAANTMKEYDELLRKNHRENVMQPVARSESYRELQF